MINANPYMGLFDNFNDESCYPYWKFPSFNNLIVQTLNLSFDRITNAKGL